MLFGACREVMIWEDVEVGGSGGAEGSEGS